jgi:mono/diheme cytochrome c family protein
MSKARVSALLAVLMGFGLSACEGGGDGNVGGSGGTGGGGPSGEDLYSGPESAKLGAGTNEATCGTCHSNDGTQDGWPGNTFKNLAFHTSFKGGMADLNGGVNACVMGWMGGTMLAADSAEYKAIKEYMESLADPAMTDPNPIQPDVLADEAAYEVKYAGGDAAAGAAVYTKACARCHDGALTVNNIPALAKASLVSLTIGRIAQQVRTAGEPPSGTMDATDTTPGPMPFFEPKDLSDQDVKDVIAHLKAQ